MGQTSQSLDGNFLSKPSTATGPGGSARSTCESNPARTIAADVLDLVSDELRNPLNTVLTAAHLLLSSGEPLSDKQTQYAQLIRDSGWRLSNHIDDILELFVLENELAQPKPCCRTVEDLTRSALRSVSALAVQKCQRLQLSIEAQLAGLTADYAGLDGALAHLLNNAVKFTPDGGQILLRVWTAVGEHLCIEHPTCILEAHRNYLVFEVNDSGVGVPPDKQTLIFESFQQADDTLCRRSGGLGIGLALVRRIARLHRGDVVCVCIGQGSTFRLMLPLT